MERKDLERIDLLVDKIHMAILSYRESSGLSNNEFCRRAGLSTNTLKIMEGERKYTEGKNERSTIGLLQVLKIISTYPALSGQIADYIRGNTEDKLTPVGKNDHAVLKRVPDFLKDDPEGDEKVREQTQWKIFHLEQSIIMRDKKIAELRQRLVKAGIVHDTEHDLTIEDA